MRFRADELEQMAVDQRFRKHLLNPCVSGRLDGAWIAIAHQQYERRGYSGALELLIDLDAADIRQLRFADNTIHPNSVAEPPEKCSPGGEPLYPYSIEIQQCGEAVPNSRVTVDHTDERG